MAAVLFILWQRGLNRFEVTQEMRMDKPWEHLRITTHHEYDRDVDVISITSENPRHNIILDADYEIVTEPKQITGGSNEEPL